MPTGIYLRTEKNKNCLGKHWKLSDKTKKRMSEAKLGKKKPPFSDEHKRKMGESRLGFKLSDETKEKIGLANSISLKGRKLSDETKRRISDALRGEKSPNWKGGNIKSLDKRIRQSFKYRQWRSDVFTRDDFTCQECGVKGGYLEAHHIKRFIKIMKENNIKNLEDALACEELWNINNGITLCRDCHNKTKKYDHRRT